jgi:hypothetical protein
MPNMSQVKSDDIEKRRVCAQCIGESFLRAQITRTGEDNQCYYCEKQGKTWLLNELADSVERAFEEHFCRTSDQPDAIEAAMMGDRESSYNWERKGEEATYAIANAAYVDEEIAEDIREVLAERHFDFEDAKMGEENEFDEHSHYTEKDPDDTEFQAEWNQFERDLHTQARFFSSSAQATLDRVFERLDEHRTKEGHLVIMEAGPGKPIAAFFRARAFQSEVGLRKGIIRPDLEIGPPPAECAVPGRMNPEGIGVFYGAQDVQTAISEVRPPVGSHVVSARFDLMRPVRLLNVEALRDVFVKGSIFDRGYLQRLQHAQFLSSLSATMSRVVLPAEERKGYLVTQVIADYLANVVKLDGILYPSVQVGSASGNVVLFHNAAAVERIAPETSRFEATLYFDDEEGQQPLFTVWEELLDEPPTRPSNNLFELPPLALEDYRLKEHRPTLRVALDSVQVHHITAAVYTSVTHPVTRHRKTKTDAF